MIAPLTAGRDTLLFGPQALALNAESFRQLRAKLLDTPNCLWILEALAELPSYWDPAIHAIPRLESFPGTKLLNSLNEWFRTGEAPEEAFPPPNILLTPLVVVIHLTQYANFLQINQRPFRHNDEVVGLCTGLLSAQVASSSKDQGDFEENGGVAIRLAMLVGALVDARDTEAGPQGESKSFSVAWTSLGSSAELARILKHFPEAYVSIMFDKKRATVTTSRCTAPSLLQQLKAAGLIVAEIALRGRFHSPFHEDDTELMITFSDAHSAFQFPDTSTSLASNGSNSHYDHSPGRKPHEVILRSILVEQSRWYQAFVALLSSRVACDKSTMTSFGSERCVPPSLLRTLGSQKIRLAEINVGIALPSTKTAELKASPSDNDERMDHQIAVVGMAVQVPGAADLEEFSQLLRSGKSQHVEVPNERFGFKTVWRDLDPQRKWYGNFIEDFDTFDHKFFRKSPREMASTDPQHRLMLQVAYQAVEQSGYFNISNRDTHIGCFIGVGLVDYENKIGCYLANAYSATGNLKAFTAGKISHYFGWTGPGLTIDTACSSSAVAVHQACQAILSGHCSAALAGGINLMTSPEWFQNLAGASFLSPTGQCKPFDFKADGYCRGEAVGAVFLKRLSTAMTDGDQIIGVIPSTNVYQNQNCTAITVPNVVSLSDLFQNVLERAGIQAKQITVVEAHGTGTPVGDPAEYDSVRKVFGGLVRAKPLSLGSVKGLVGHTEFASGIVALVKILLMILEGFIPPQPSFEKINPSMNASPSDNIEITTSLTQWNVDFRAALINSYGASGSNASLVVTQAIQLPYPDRVHDSLAPLRGAKYPFWFSGFDEQSLRTYVARFRRFLEGKAASTKWSVADLAFQTYRQSNHSLRQALILNCGSTEELKEKLRAFENGNRDVAATVPPGPRPVILCFGGQVSTFIGLDRQVYENVQILRRHLNQCNHTCKSLGLSGIYPEIFQREPIADLVTLQTSLFAIQYSCAKSWIDCGIEVAAVVGHSFGELTALCVSGALSIEDTIKIIAGRARLIQDYWGPEKGSMMAVEGDLEMIKKLLAESSHDKSQSGATIACFNSPRNFTLAGSTKAIEVVAEVASKSPAFSSIKMKKLHVTNAFHSTLVEPLLGDLEQIGREIDFKEPSVRLERATEFESAGLLTPRYVADHMRNPVYFDHAVQRLYKLYDSCVWLEAGSNSTVTTMASRARASPSSSHFQPVNITSNDGFKFLADVTASLWREGLNVSFWPHHPSQRSQYPMFYLPPYQFEKSKHWMDLKKLPVAAAQTIVQEAKPTGMWTFVGYQDEGNRSVRFRINTMTEEFRNYLLGYVVLQTAPACPSTLQLHITTEALMSLLPSATVSKLQPQMQALTTHAPMTLDPSKYVWLDAQRDDTQSLVWDFMISSNAEQGGPAPTLHISGRIFFRSDHDSESQAEFAKYERLVGMKRCLNLLDSNTADEVIQGRNIYRSFSDVVQCSEPFKCVQKIVGKDDESAGCVVKKATEEGWMDVGLSDSFCQIAGVFVNCMIDLPDTDVFIHDKIDQWIRSPKIRADSGWRGVLNVFCCHQRPSEKYYVSDVFIFDPRNGALLEVILGIHFRKIPKDTMRKALLKITPGAKTPLPAAVSAPMSVEATKTLKPSESPSNKPKKKTSQPNIAPKVRSLLSTLSGLEPEEIKDNSELGDIGIDSLMGMEVAREIEIAFKCSLDESDLLGLTDFSSLIHCITKALGDVALGTNDESGEIDNEVVEDESPVSNGFTSDVDDDVEDEAPTTNGVPPYVNGFSHDIDLSAAAILESFKQVKQATDQFIVDYRLAGYVDHVLPKLNELCVIHILDACDELGCSIRNAKSGDTVESIEYLPRHEQFVQVLYDFLKDTARLVDIDGSQLTRTAISCPVRSAKAMLEELLRVAPDHTYDHKLTYLTGVKLADCLTGKSDAIQLILGTPEGREIASGMYSTSPISVAWIEQIKEFLGKLLTTLPQGGPIKVLEIGSGTGGTTSAIVSLLASLKLPVEYTVTDLSSSLVANARKRFKKYSFMKFKVVDIEKPPSPELLHSQHIVIATNCVHATHRLVNSTKNIHDILRPDGMLMMLEMTETLPWIDLIFGLVEGWWLFDDGRQHALVSPSVWEGTLEQVGFGHVDWTEGRLPEANVQRVIIALASNLKYDRANPSLGPRLSAETHVAARQAVIDAYIEKHVRRISFSSTSYDFDHSRTSDSFCVLVTGASGSLGSQLVAYLSSLSDVQTVICLNRHGRKDPTLRQREAFESRGILLSPESLPKIRVLETDMAKPKLGLPDSDYETLLHSVTHLVHSAWPMSITKPVKAFESQFKTMANLVELACEISSIHPKGFQMGFQFTSSIATVGCHTLPNGQTRILEESVTAGSLFPSGYAEAKLVCERIIDETLHKHPDRFRPMVARIGQIAGSQSSGHWNSAENIPFLLKSSQTLRKLPDLQGTLSWCPVESVAATLAELLLSTKEPYRIYHVENPSRQPWQQMVALFADELKIPRANVVPFDKWVHAVRQFPGSKEKDNPAAWLTDFWDNHFVRVSCGDLILDTTKSEEHSPTLACEGPVSDDLARKYIRAWKDMGFLQE